MKKYNENKGITLISLVVSIIILLIIVGISVNIAIGNNGVLTMAQKSVSKNRIATIEEYVGLWKNEKLFQNAKNISVFVSDLQKEGLINDSQKVEILSTGKLVVDDHIIKFFDIIPIDNLRQGDWVDYPLNPWTEEEINSLGELYVERFETNNDYFKFSEFSVGDSKSESRGESGNKYAGGWRILNVNKDTGIIKLISAGTVELYNHSTGDYNGYKSKYILSGEKDDEDTTDITNGVKVRNWDMYVNKEFATEAHCLSYNEAYAIKSNEIGIIGVYVNLPEATSVNNGKVLFRLCPTGGIESGQRFTERRGIRVVVTLKTNQSFCSGDGTEANPYKFN